jgi:hypothetical protein
MNTKICSKCKIDKEICEFRKCSKMKCGFQSECKMCAKISYNLNREKNLLNKKIYTEKNKDKKSEYDKHYRLKNRLKKNEYIRNYRRMKRLNDPTFRIVESVRSRIKIFLKTNNIQKFNKTFYIVGCKPEELRKFLESKFTDNMSWDNYGKWHIDHIIPLSSAKTEQDILKLCHYTNLQPLWAKDNIIKSNKIIKT